jgi:hypothetical protein
MKHVKLVTIAALATIAFSAIVAAAAQAAINGPLIYECKKEAGGTLGQKCFTGTSGEFKLNKLGAGATAPFEVKMASTEYVLENGVQTLRCKKQKVEAGAALKGAAAKTSASSEEVIVFEECTVAGNGEPCKPVGGKITTVPVNDILDFANEKSVAKETILTTFKPVKGSVFTTIKFEGAGCTVTEATVEGSVAAEAVNEKGETVKAEEAKTEEPLEIGFVNFPTTLLKVEWVEEAGVRKEIKTSLKSFGKAAKAFIGKTEIKLTNKDAWAIKTK